MTAMEPIVPLSAMEQIAPGIDHAEGICLYAGRDHPTSAASRARSTASARTGPPRR